MTENIPAGRFVVDPTHSEVGFSVKHLMISKVKGKFNSFGGTIVVGKEGELDSIVVNGLIDVVSVDTNQADRDGHLKTGDFFDAENFPTISFISNGVKHIRGDKYEIYGDIKIKNVTKPLTLDIEFGGVAVDGYGQTKIAAEAHAVIKREDFGLTWNSPLESGGVLLGSNVNLDLDIQATLTA